jgi:hypothetical protein
LSVRHVNRATANKLQKELMPMLTELAVAGAKEKLFLKLKSKYRVASDVRQPTGARVLTLNI